MSSRPTPPATRDPAPPNDHDHDYDHDLDPAPAPVSAPAGLAPAGLAPAGLNVESDAAAEAGSHLGGVSNSKCDTRVHTLDGFDVVVRQGHQHEALALIGSHQQGCVARRQLLVSDWSAEMIRTAMRRRRLHPRRKGVYAVGHLAATRLSAQAEALLDVGDDALLVGRSVLAHHALIPGDDEVHVGVTSSRRPRRRPGIRVHYFTGLRGAVTDGIPMTSVARAILDVAHHLDRRTLECLVDEAVAAQRKATRGQISAELRDDPGHPGHAALLSVMDERRPNSATESLPAAQMLSLIRQAGLPEPETEVWLYGFRVDKYWSELGLVLEVESHTFHGLIRANYTRDIRKRRVLAAHGLEVMSVDAGEIAAEPFKVIAELSAAIARLTAAAQPPAVAQPPAAAQRTGD